jgi:hypothetical protein
MSSCISSSPFHGDVNTRRLSSIDLDGGEIAFFEVRTTESARQLGSFLFKGNLVNVDIRVEFNLIFTGFVAAPSIFHVGYFADGCVGGDSK